MRAIKFRGKNTVTGEWGYGYFWKDDICGDCYIREGNGVDHRVDPDTVSQLVCINWKGHEIYEGDIVRNIDDYSIWHVAYSLNDMGFTAALIKTGEFDESDEFEMRWLEDCEVIGNIWDDRLKDFYDKEGKE